MPNLARKPSPPLRPQPAATPPQAQAKVGARRVVAPLDLFLLLLLVLLPVKVLVLVLVLVLARLARTLTPGLVLRRLRVGMLCLATLAGAFATRRRASKSQLATVGWGRGTRGRNRSKK